MVTSIDGATMIDGTSGGLSSATDHELLLGLRSMADVVIVGAATVRAEGYGAPRKAGLRIGVVTASTAGLDWTMPLFATGAGFVITTEDAPEVPVPAVRAGVGDVDLAAAVAQLDIGMLQAEGGALLNGSLAAADLIDELNLTISPQLSGGDGPRLTAGAPDLSQRMSLVHVLEDDGFLFTRYVRER